MSDQFAVSPVLRLPRRVVVTGGSSGIGLACAKLFHDSGASVGLIGRSRARLDAAASTLTGLAAADLHRNQRDSEPAASRIFVAEADVAQEDAVDAAVRQLARALGGIDALIVCAGIEGEMGPAVAEASSTGFREVLDVNVLGAFHAVKAALPLLREADAASVTLIGSDSGFVAVPGMVAYNASKGAIVQLTRALAVELHDAHGIRVNSVAPSIVDTPMARRDLGDEVIDNPEFPIQSAEDVAWSVAYLSSRQARAVNGQTLLSDFGYTGRSSFPA